MKTRLKITFARVCSRLPSKFIPFNSMEVDDGVR